MDWRGKTCKWQAGGAMRAREIGDEKLDFLASADVDVDVEVAAALAVVVHAGSPAQRACRCCVRGAAAGACDDRRAAHTTAAFQITWPAHELMGIWFLLQIPTASMPWCWRN